MKDLKSLIQKEENGRYYAELKVKNILTGSGNYKKENSLGVNINKTSEGWSGFIANNDAIDQSELILVFRFGSTKKQIIESFEEFLEANNFEFIN